MDRRELLSRAASFGLLAGLAHAPAGHAGTEPATRKRAANARQNTDESARADAYRRMTAIFLEHNPWIAILQPFEDYGLRRDIDFTPTPTSSSSCAASTSGCGAAEARRQSQEWPRGGRDEVSEL
jgi:hypothetical protein